MSENYRFYPQRTDARRARPARRLGGQWAELMRVVARCEAMWALEDRIERSR